MTPDEWRERLIDACTRYRSSLRYAEQHPEDPHGGDELDYCNDMIDEAARQVALAHPDELLTLLGMEQVGWFTASMAARVPPCPTRREPMTARHIAFTTDEIALALAILADLNPVSYKHASARAVIEKAHALMKEGDLSERATVRVVG